MDIACGNGLHGLSGVVHEAVFVVFSHNQHIAKRPDVTVHRVKHNVAIGIDQSGNTRFPVVVGRAGYNKKTFATGSLDVGPYERCAHFAAAVADGVLVNSIRQDKVFGVDHAACGKITGENFFQVGVHKIHCVGCFPDFRHAMRKAERIEVFPFMWIIPGEPHP